MVALFENVFQPWRVKFDVKLLYMWMDSKILIHLGGVYFGILSAKAWGHLVQEIVKAAFSTFLTSQIFSLPSFGSLRKKIKIYM